MGNWAKPARFAISSSRRAAVMVSVVAAGIVNAPAARRRKAKVVRPVRAMADGFNSRWFAAIGRIRSWDGECVMGED